MFSRLEKTFALATLAGAFIAGPAQAVLIPVFDYQFPASYDGSVSTVIDQSTSQKNGVASTTLALSNIIPAGAPANTRSIDLVATPGRINTNAIDLFTSTNIAQAGGFSYEVWFNPTGVNTGGIKKIIDFAGTDFIAYDTNSQPTVSIGLSNMGIAATYTGGGIDPNGWNHAIVTFDSTGNAIAGGVISGNLTVTVNNVAQDFGAKTVGIFGDSLNRTTGIGQHPLGGEQFNGLIYSASGALGNGTPAAPPVLLGHWTLDELASPSGNTTALDSSGNGRNGTYQPLAGPGPTLGMPGVFGTAAHFNGTTDEIYLASPTAFRMPNNFTIAAWINPDDLDGVQRIFSQAGGGFGFGITGDELRITTYGILDYNTTGVDLVAGEFQHVAVAFDVLNDAYFYLNGELVQVISGLSPANISSANFFIGATGLGERFAGIIDDVYLFQGTLSADEIRAIAGLIPIPEPASFTLLGLGALAMLRRRRAVA